MSEDKDFSVFIKSGHVLYWYFLCCSFLFETFEEKKEKYNSQKNLPFYSMSQQCNVAMLN